MQKTMLDIELTLLGPILTQSSSPGQLGLDALAARNHKGDFIIPGTLIEGRLRQALEELKTALDATGRPNWFEPKIDNWLGLESYNDFPKTKRLFFADFVLGEPEPESATRYRIKIDPERESAKQRQLAILESPFASGQEYKFTGQAQFFSSQQTAETITLHLNAALQWLSQLGGFRTIGFGRVALARINSPQYIPIPQPDTINQTAAPERIGFCITLEDPFCLAGKPNTTENNLFQSEAIIPGGAIKGCIATTWNHLLDQQGNHINPDGGDRTELREHFSRLRFSHVFPGKDFNQRPVVAPLSLVRTEKDGPLYDVALLAGPCLIKEKPVDFAVDWKNGPDTLTQYPWPYIRFKDWGWDSTQTELRVRTAISRSDLRSEEEKLFAYEQIIPDDKNWYGELDLSRIDEPTRTIVWLQLQSLCSQGLFGLGKTKAPLRIEFCESVKPKIPSDPNPVDNDIWMITLQTDALLGSPETLDESSGEYELRQFYETVWQDLSGNRLQLLNYFARQRLSGGRHRQNTLQKDALNYRPWLLTEAGSVFVLQAADAPNPSDIKKLITKWLTQGLPLTPAAIDWYGLGDDPTRYWQSCPFVQENGYGEIAVNLRHENVIQLKEGDGRVELITQITSKKGN